MQRSKKVIALAAAAAAAVAQVSWLAPRAGAADIRWDGGGTDNNLNTPANWVGDVNPATTDIARFDAVGATKLTPTTDGGGVQYNTIFFGNLATAAEADAYTIGGANAITLGSTTAGNYLNNDSEALQTINAPLNMIGGTIGAWNAGLSFGGLLNVGNGAAASGGNSVTFQGANNITLAGGITGAATGANDNARIIKSGAGTLFVTADSAAWLGRVLINTGAVQISNANALGSGGGSIFTAGNQNTGALELTGNIALTKTVQTHGREQAAINSVSLRNVSGNNSVSNVVTSTGGNQFNYESVADNLTINTWNTTGSTGTSRILRVLGAGNGEIQTWTPAAGAALSVVKDGTGTWSLRSGMNNASGTFSNVTVNGGTLVFDGGLGSRVIGTSTIAPNVTVNNGGTLRVVSADGTTGEVGTSALNTTLNVKAGGTLDASSFTTYFVQTNQTLVAGGTIQTGGTLRADADAIIRIGDVAAPSAGTMTVIGNLGLSNADALPNGGVHFDLSSASTDAGGGVNDLISVQGDLQAINTAGPVNIHINSLGGGFATGTYRLIDFTSGTTPNAADFNLVGFAAGTTRQTAAITSDVNQLNLTVSGAPLSITWKGDGAGNAWDVAGTANFADGATPEKFFQFDSVTFDDTTANTTVNTAAATFQPGAITVNTAQTYTIGGGGTFAGVVPLTKSGTGTLILANTGGGVLSGGITINEGTLQIGTGNAEGPLWSGPVANNGTLIINRIDSVTPGLISGSGALEKRGDGDLVLNAAHTYTGATTIHQGRALANNAGAFGDAATGTTVNPGGQIYFVSPATTYNEAFTVAGDGPAALGVLRAGGGTIQTLAAPVTFTANSTFNTDGGATLNLTSTLTGTGDLTKIGSGTVVVGGAGSTWTGNTNITLGRLEFGAGDVAVDVPAGNISLAAGATLAFGSSQPVTFARPLTGAGILAQGSGGGTTTVTGDLTGFTGTLSTSQGGVASTLVVATPTNAATATVSDSGGGNGFGVLRLTHSQALPSTATINVVTQQVAGTGRLELGNNVDVNVAAINVNQKNNTTASILSADGNNSLTGAINLFTGGNNGTIEAAEGATLTVGGTIQPGAGVTTTRNLHLQGAGTGTANATIHNGIDTNLNVHKNGAGTWTLTAANTYTGSTNVNAGTLRVENDLTSSAAVNVAGGTLQMADGGGSNRILRAPAVSITGDGRVDLRDNKLITDAPAGTFNGTAYTGIQGDVQRAYNFGAWDQPGLTTSMPNAGQNAGVLSNTETIGVATASQVLFIEPTDTAVFQGQTVTGASTIAMYTYAGDLNFDGLVDGADYGVIDNSVQFPGTDGYVNGDFNYDGVIDGADYGVIDNTIQLQGAPFPGVTFGAGAASELSGGLSGVTAVPEPSACGFAILSAAALLGRRRRRQCGGRS